MYRGKPKAAITITIATIRLSEEPGKLQKKT